jgi:Fur family transcriptional regulator, peroxide stress response regulator
LTNRIYSYIVSAMNTEYKKISDSEIDEKSAWFVKHCREKGLKVTPQRMVIYQELLKTDRHPSAEMLYAKIKHKFPNISLDTVNRTLITLSEIGAAFIVEGSGDVRRYDAGMTGHQHFRCVKCKRIIDFHHKPFDDVKLPEYIDKKFVILRKTVYVEGICDKCR